MSLIGVLGGFGVSLIVGVAVVSMLLPQHSSVRDRLLMASLGLGLGLGLTSCAFFLWLAVAGPPGGMFILAEGAAVACLIVWGASGLRGARWCPAGPAGARRSTLSIVSLVLWGSVASAVVAFALLVGGAPHGRWDAWMTWNLRARFFVRAGEYWRDGFSDLLRHGDYPLLIPASVARAWTYAGTEMLLAPALVALCFTLATAILLYAGVRALRGPEQAALATLVLLGTSFFVFHGASQYADVPLAFFVLGTVVLLSLGDVLPEMAPRTFLLAGAAAGLGAWTKNEGLVFLVSLMVARSLIAAWNGTIRNEARRFGMFTLGLAPILLVVGYFKLAFPVPNDLLSEQGLGMTLGRLLETGRWVAVARAFKAEVLGLGHNGLLSAPALLFVYALCLGPASEGPRRHASMSIVLTLVLTLSGYALVFLTAPTDVPRLLAASVDRVFLHVWPAAVFCCFLAMKAPAEVLDRPLHRALDQG